MQRRPLDVSVGVVRVGQYGLPLAHAERTLWAHRYAQRNSQAAIHTSEGSGHRMRISVTEVGRTFGRQTRAYAEYRVFSSIARFGDVARDVEVSLTSRLARASAECVVTVIVRGDASVTVSARGCHAYDAINRASERTADALRRHSDPSWAAARHGGSIDR